MNGYLHVSITQISHTHYNICNWLTLKPLYPRLFFNLHDLVSIITLFIFYIYFSNNVTYHHFYFIKQMIAIITVITIILLICIAWKANMILLLYSVIILKMDLAQILYWIDSIFHYLI